MPASTVIFVRHGQTPANAEQVWHGQRDTPLSALGEQQRLALGPVFKELHPVPDRLVSSTLQRARLTAEAIGDELGMAVQQFPELMEYDIGEWEGQPYSALRGELGFFKDLVGDAHYRPPGGESRHDVTTRFVNRVQDLCEETEGVLVVVAHGMAISFALSHWLNGSSDQWLDYRMSNTGVTSLCWNERKLHYFDNVTHLESLV
jgi:broad specificity phosphatase PhoE